jgi:hypothetical protein
MPQLECAQGAAAGPSQQSVVDPGRDKTAVPASNSAPLSCVYSRDEVAQMMQQSKLTGVTLFWLPVGPAVTFVMLHHVFVRVLQLSSPAEQESTCSF